VFLAIDEGILVKCGPDVFVSTRHAVRGPDLGGLKETVVARFKAIDSREKKARVAMARIEAGFVRRFLELRDRG
jgi:F-type H+-transporting ATPase subunit epsilon